MNLQIRHRRPQLADRAGTGADLCPDAPCFRGPEICAAQPPDGHHDDQTPEPATGHLGFRTAKIAATVVTASGSLTEPRPAELLMVQALEGAGAGAIVTLLVGFLKHGISTHK